MSVKYFDSKGNEKHLGDVISYSNDLSRDGLTISHSIKCSLVPESVPFLREIGAIKVVKEKSKDLTYYFRAICKENNLAPNILKKIFEISPSIALSLCLRTIAVDLDEKYEGDISECKTIWIFDMMSGQPTEVPTKMAKNLRNFAAFRNREDIDFAMKTCSPIIKNMYSFGK